MVLMYSGVFFFFFLLNFLFAQKWTDQTLSSEGTSESQNSLENIKTCTESSQRQSAPKRNSKKAVFSYKNTFNPLHRAFSVDLVSANVIFASNSCIFRAGKKKVSQAGFPYIIFFFLKEGCMYTIFVEITGTNEVRY